MLLPFMALNDLCLLLSFCKSKLINAIFQMNYFFTLKFYINGGEYMAIDYSVIGERLKKARKECHMTQEQLAEKIDVSIAFLSRIERGSSQINLKRLSQICEILDVTEGDILNGSSSKSIKYLDLEFANLLKNCSSEDQRLIYDIAKVIANKNNSENK